MSSARKLVMNRRQQQLVDVATSSGSLGSAACAAAIAATLAPSSLPPAGPAALVAGAPPLAGAAGVVASSEGVGSPSTQIPQVPEEWTPRSKVKASST